VYKISGLDDNAIGNEYRVWKRGEIVCAEVKLNDRARKQITELARTNIGKFMAVIVDGKVQCTMVISNDTALVIGNEVYDGWFPVHGDWELKDARAFCKKITDVRISRQESVKPKP
jgi:hypothetical protein